MSPSPDITQLLSRWQGGEAEALKVHDERKARVVELHYSGGLKYDEMAVALGLSEATVHRQLRFSRAWLKDRLAGESEGRPA